MRKSPHRKEKILTLQRETEAMRLRVEGHNLEAIGKALGITPQGASKVLYRAFGKAHSELKEMAAHEAVVDFRRIEKLVKVIWPKAENGDLHAIDRVVRLLERKAKLLGLDAAIKAELSGPDGAPLSPLVGVVVLPPEVPLDGLPTIETSGTLVPESRPSNGTPPIDSE